jgi:hypothetical protein
VQEGLEPFDLGEPAEQLDLLLAVERARVHAGLDLVPQPAYTLRVLEVLELVADWPQ